MKSHKLTSRRASRRVVQQNDKGGIQIPPEYQKSVFLRRHKKLPADVALRLTKKELELCKKQPVYVLRKYDGTLVACAYDFNVLHGQCIVDGLTMYHLH